MCIPTYKEENLVLAEENGRHANGGDRGSGRWYPEAEVHRPLETLALHIVRVQLQPHDLYKVLDHVEGHREGLAEAEEGSGFVRWRRRFRVEELFDYLERWKT